MARCVRALLLLLAMMMATPGLACHEATPAPAGASSQEHAGHHSDAPAPATDDHDHLGLCCAVSLTPQRTIEAAAAQWPAGSFASKIHALANIASALDPPPPRIG